MNLTIKDLTEGMNWWLQKTGWPQDFHNAVYYELYNLKMDGLSDSWWDETVDRLWHWRAIRPLSKTVILKRGLEVLPSMRKAYLDLWNKSQDEPSFLDCEWQEAAQLYNILSGIKGSHSPVFPSKLGHFIFPKLFVVMDNKATGTNDYQVFWQSMKEGWNEFNEKQEARDLLTQQISRHSSSELHKHYPLEIKIIELCNIGKNSNSFDCRFNDGQTQKSKGDN